MTRPLRRRALGTGVLALLAAAPMAAEEPAPAAGERRPRVEEARACLEIPLVVVYVHRLQDRVLEAWGLPEDSLADQEVIVKLQVAEDGALVSHEVVSWSNTRLAYSVAAALAEAAPFEAVPEGARCIVGRNLVLKFQNVY